MKLIHVIKLILQLRLNRIKQGNIKKEGFNHHKRIS